MLKTDGKANVLAITENIQILESVNATFKDEGDFQILDNTSLVDGIETAVAKLQPQLILLDFDYKKEESYNLIDKIATDFPAVAVVVILPEEKVQLTDKIILAGARAFILSPFITKNLLSTSRRVVELLKRNYPTLTQQDMGIAQPKKPKNTFTVFSPKGGAGTTTIAVNLAIALRQSIKEPVLLVDGKHLFGHLTLMLNLRTANSMTDLISHAGMLDQHLINQVVVDHVSGIKVLPSPVTVTEGQGIRPDDLYKVILGLQTSFPVIVIDGGNSLNENTVTYMDASDRIILLLNPNLASVRDTKQFIDVCKSLSYPPEKVILVLNNYGHKSDIRKEEIEGILRQKVAAVIPSDENFVISSLNEGVPVLLKNPHHPISKAIQDFAKLIKNYILEANLAYTQTEKKVNADILAKTSRLG